MREKKLVKPCEPPKMTQSIYDARFAEQNQAARINALTIEVTYLASRFEPPGEVTPGWSALAANLCPFSGCWELAGFTEDFGEPVGEAAEATARSAVW